MKDQNKVSGSEAQSHKLPFLIPTNITSSQRWYFHGYGLNSQDQIKWVTNSASEDHHCDGHAYSTSTGKGMAASGAADHAVEFDVLFHQSDSSDDGPWKMCYKFYNETTPWKLYGGMSVEVRQFYNVSGAEFGETTVAVAHRQKHLTLNGFGVANGDRIRWIDTATMNCTSEGVDKVSYEDIEWWETHSPTTGPTLAPTKAPSKAPTQAPSMSPTIAPTKGPTKAPTKAPTRSPTISPTKAPTTSPTKAPTKAPSTAPSIAPTTSPTKAPTRAPTAAPVVTSP